MSETTEQMIQRKGLTAPRITPQYINDVIVRQHFHLFPGTTTMACLLELKNGFTVLGKSACADPKNFDIDVGMRVAREDAEDKVWELEGYLLKERLHQAALLLKTDN